jgi:hypothetical protein
MNRGQLGDTVGWLLDFCDGDIRSEKVFPPTKIALETHALGNLKRLR